MLGSIFLGSHDLSFWVFRSTLLLGLASLQQPSGLLVPCPFSLALCPFFLDTQLASAVSTSLVDKGGGMCSCVCLLAGVGLNTDPGFCCTV